MCAPRLMHGKQGEAQAFFLQMGTKMRVCIRGSLLLDLPVGPWASHRCAMPCRVPYARPGATSRRYSQYGAASARTAWLAEPRSSLFHGVLARSARCYAAALSRLHTCAHLKYCMVLSLHSALANSPKNTQKSAWFASFEPRTSGCEVVAACLVARRMLRTVQQGARPFFATMALEDSHRIRMWAMHYLKAGTPVSQRFVMQRWLP